MKDLARPRAVQEGVKYEWVTGYEGMYAITSDGRIFSYKRNWRTQSGAREMKLKIHKQGYLEIGLWDRANTYQRYFLVHRLVLEVFVGPCPEGMECCHCNGDPADNRLKNLRWDTSGANYIDTVDHGNAILGSDVYNAKLTEDDVVLIHRAYAAGYCTYSDLGSAFGVSSAAIQKVISRKNWKHVELPADLAAKTNT